MTFKASDFSRRACLKNAVRTLLTFGTLIRTVLALDMGQTLVRDDMLAGPLLSPILCLRRLLGFFGQADHRFWKFDRLINLVTILPHATRRWQRRAA
jgi:hypothetical protein